MWTELRTTECCRVRNGGCRPGRSCPQNRGSFSILAATKRLNDRARVRIKSYANLERAMSEARLKWDTQSSHKLPILKKRDFILGYKQEHHASPSCEEEEEENGGEKEEEVEEIDDDEDDEVDEGWPVDEDIDERWRVNAADYFKEPRIRNVVAEDGTVIDWEGESHRGIIQEISCMEWERTVFHHSPLIVLLFERYARASTNWKVLKELENAIKVYRKYKKLPPRTVKVDVKIEIDLASALRAKDIPQLLFIKGDKLLYRETEIRTADELVKMIAHFYYNAKRPSFLEVV